MKKYSLNPRKVTTLQDVINVLLHINIVFFINDDEELKDSKFKDIEHLLIEEK